uniref:Ribosomal protein L32 n=1 Tax=Romanomermis culicivorax TaxID=13658 RepID=A0A915L4H5_ROMCU
MIGRKPKKLISNRENRSHVS